MISVLFTKCANWKYLYIAADPFKIQFIMDLMTIYISLLGAKDITRQEIILVLCVNTPLSGAFAHEINEIHAHISRLIAAFAAAPIDDFMHVWISFRSTTTRNNTPTI
eukprot:843523_1